MIKIRTKDNYTHALAEQIRNDSRERIIRTQGSEIRFNIFSTEGLNTPFQHRLESEAKKIQENAEVNKFYFQEGSRDEEIEIERIPFVVELPFAFRFAPDAAMSIPPAFNADGSAICNMSACAEGLAGVIQCYEERFSNLHVVICGRGDSVRGLQHHAQNNLDCTVSVIHSHTRAATVKALIESADVIVNAAPIDYGDMHFQPRAIMLDVSGSAWDKEEDPYNPDLLYYSPHDIGEVTGAILINRIIQIGE